MINDVIEGKCPVCRSDLDIMLRPLMVRQTRILEAIERLKRDRGRLPSAPQIAAEVERPLASVKLELHTLESGHRVCRPNGVKSGWDVQHSQDVTIVARRRSMVA